MTKKVFKYIFTQQVLFAPRGKVLLVGNQNRDWLPTIWIEVDNMRNCLDVEYRFIGTGDDVPENSEHVGSAICGEYVWHVYRMGGDD